jgi:hypothetical protein
MVAEECQDERYIELREVFYDQLGKPLGHGSATVGGENVEEIRQYLTWALEALDKPVLNFGDDDGDIGQDTQ